MSTGFALVTTECAPASGRLSYQFWYKQRITHDNKQDALSMGSKDFVTKPLDVMGGLTTYIQLAGDALADVELAVHNDDLEEKVRDRHAVNLRPRSWNLQRLALAAEVPDDCIAHSASTRQRVGHLAAFPSAVHRAPEQIISSLYAKLRAAPLHERRQDRHTVTRGGAPRARSRTQKGARFAIDSHHSRSGISRPLQTSASFSDA